VFGQEAVLPVEVNMQVCRVVRQNDLPAKDYTYLMMDKLDKAPEGRFKAMMEIEKEKLQTAKAYNRKVREKSFQVGGFDVEDHTTIGYLRSEIRQIVSELGGSVPGYQYCTR
jgi:hypothetical protein